MPPPLSDRLPHKKAVADMATAATAKIVIVFFAITLKPAGSRKRIRVAGFLHNHDVWQPMRRRFPKVQHNLPANLFQDWNPDPLNSGTVYPFADFKSRKAGLVDGQKRHSRLMGTALDSSPNVKKAGIFHFPVNSIW